MYNNIIYHQTIKSFCRFSPKNEEQRISCVKKLDDTGSRVLLQKIKRTHIVARRQGTKSTRSAPESGWKAEICSYPLHWFKDETSPALSAVICNEIDHSQESHGESNNDLYDY